MLKESNITAPTQFIGTKLRSMPIAASGAGQAYHSYVFSTLPEPWTIGIRPSPIPLLWGAR